MKEDYNPATDVLKDRVVMVTGAGEGIGRTAALAFAECGATVILLGRTADKLERLSDDIISEGFAEPAIAVLDLEKIEGDILNDLSNGIIEQYGRLDGLLHNASILGDRTTVEHYNPALWQRVMQTNVGGVFLLTQAMLPLLRLSNDARLLFTSSSVGAKPRAYWGAYSVSKYAMEGFALLLADELENTANVRVNIVNPGATRTAMRASAYPGEDPLTLKTADNLIPLYLYLMGPDSISEHGKTFNA